MRRLKSNTKIDNLENKIILLRGERVMIDADLALLYGVSTKVLNQSVKRNRERFPQAFMFQLTDLEKGEVVTNWGWIN